MNVKKGDIVGRKSYGKDIFFIVDTILTTRQNKKFAILKGVNVRIMADAILVWWQWIFRIFRYRN